MDANGIVLIIGAVFLGIAKVVSMVLDYRREQAKIERDHAAAGKVEEVRKEAVKTATVAAEKAEEVKTALANSNSVTDAKLKGIEDTGRAVHVLVNSNMATQLKISKVALHRIAELTKHPDDIAAAELAEKSYLEHEAKQAAVDASQKPK